MTDPLALISMAVAAGGGTIDQWPAAQLVAAGITLLQRSAPLVRALSARRAGILLPTHAAYFTAIAASDGRGAVLINPLASRHEIIWQIEDARIGAVFTNRELAPLLPATIPRVLLDNTPHTALVDIDNDARTIDLGSHFGLALEGDRNSTGLDEEALIVYTFTTDGIPHRDILTHRDVISSARATIVAMQNAAQNAARDTANDHTLVALPYADPIGLVAGGIAPLIAGAHISTTTRRILDMP